MNYPQKEKFLREVKVADITGLSRTTRWRLEKEEIFPRRYQISDGITAYKESEVMKWLESRPVCSGQDIDPKYCIALQGGFQQ